MTEHEIQSQFFAWLDKVAVKLFGLPKMAGGFPAWATPNAGKRSPRTGARMKREGLRAGVPDVFIAVPTEYYGGLFIEFKTAKGRVSQAQKNMMEDLAEAGYHCAVCRSVDEGIDVVTKYIGGLV
jgi:hypothetical protein